MKNLFILVATAISLTSCSSTKSLYSWYDYEDATYQYSKKQTDELKLKVLEEYKLLTEKQKGTRGVAPPGLNAEYGYMLYRTGKQEEGLALMKKEIELYPESEKYISRIIKQKKKKKILYC